MAFPDGRDRPERTAILRPMTSRSGSWTWTVRCGLAYTAGVASNNQVSRQPFESSRVLGDRKGPCGFSGRVPLPGAEL